MNIYHKLHITDLRAVVDELCSELEYKEPAELYVPLIKLNVSSELMNEGKKNAINRLKYFQDKDSIVSLHALLQFTDTDFRVFLKKELVQIQAFMTLQIQEEVMDSIQDYYGWWLCWRLVQKIRGVSVKERARRLMKRWFA